jgi:hypothetical protein
MSHQRERGAVLVLVVVGMLALIAIAGLAIDSAHVLLNKSRLQSALDAAALAAAKVLDQTASTAKATTAAGSVFTLNLAQYPELQSAVGGGVSLTTEYSSTLNPFSAGTTPAAFVRTSITGFRTAMSLVSVLGISSISVAGNAVAGPSPAVVQECNVIPVYVCGNSTAGANGLYGYQANQVTALNQQSGAAIGPGNFGYLALGGNGAATLRTTMAGNSTTCATIGGSVSTEPGVASGPVSQGFNTRFNIYKGPVSAAQYPPDVINSAAHQTNLSMDANGNAVQAGQIVTTGSQLTFNYADDQALVAAGTYDTQPLPTGTAAFGRRVMAAPVGDCSGFANGKSTVTVNGFICVFLLQALTGGGKDPIFGEVIGKCEAGGRPGAGSSVTGPHIIELYKSAGSPDS